MRYEPPKMSVFVSQLRRTCPEEISDLCDNVRFSGIVDGLRTGTSLSDSKTFLITGKTFFWS